MVDVNRLCLFWSNVNAPVVVESVSAIQFEQLSCLRVVEPVLALVALNHKSVCIVKRLAKAVERGVFFRLWFRSGFPLLA